MTVRDSERAAGFMPAVRRDSPVGSFQNCARRFNPVRVHGTARQTISTATAPLGTVRPLCAGTAGRPDLLWIPNPRAAEGDNPEAHAAAGLSRSARRPASAAGLAAGLYRIFRVREATRETAAVDAETSVRAVSSYAGRRVSGCKDGVSDRRADPLGRQVHSDADAARKIQRGLIGIRKDRREQA
jgi:hypothetical protein